MIQCEKEYSLLSFSERVKYLPVNLLTILNISTYIKSVNLSHFKSFYYRIVSKLQPLRFFHNLFLIYNKHLVSFLKLKPILVSINNLSTLLTDIYKNYKLSFEDNKSACVSSYIIILNYFDYVIRSIGLFHETTMITFENSLLLKVYLSIRWSNLF